MQQLLIDDFGGLSGVRDIGLVESAVMRPQCGYYNDLIEEAAALMESLARNHGFNDGNKRIAFTATDTFLRINGFYIDCEALLTYRMICEMFETQTFRFENILIWLKDVVNRSGS